MEIAFVIVVSVVAPAMSPMTRRELDAGRRFARPHSEGDLL